MGNRFDQLISDDEGTSSDLSALASDQSRRANARFDFLRRAVVLTIARPNNDERLWNMLAELQSRTRGGSSPEVRRANQRLAEFIASTDRLLATDEHGLDRFFRRSRTDLLALRDRRYDFLIPFRDIATSRHATAELHSSSCRPVNKPRGSSTTSASQAATSATTSTTAASMFWSVSRGTSRPPAAAYTRVQ